MKTTTTTNDVRGNGNFWLIRQKSSSGGWKRDWQVKLSLPGSGKDRMESGRTFVPEACAICPECLAVPAGMSPTKVRPGCACTRGLRVFYERFLKQQRKAHALLVKEERFGEIEALVAPRAKMRFGEILPLIRENGPKGSRQVNAYALRNLVEGIFGGRLEEVAIEDLTWARIVDWARMYQEYGRRGWTVREEQQSSRAAEQQGCSSDRCGSAALEAGALRAARWAELRGLLAAGKLPKLDVETVAPWNTTIKTVVRMVKACLGNKARSMMLLSVADRLPVLRWTEPKAAVLALPCPKGRQFERSQYERFWEALPKLRVSDPQLWLYLQLSLKLGTRSREPLAVRQHWLEADGDGNVVLLLQNRPEEGFYLKARDRSRPRLLALEKDVVEVISQVMCPVLAPKVGGKGWKRGLRFGPGGERGGLGDVVKGESGKVRGGRPEDEMVMVSVLGCATRTAGAVLYRRASAWIRGFVPSGSATLYLLRHNAITARAVHEGPMAAAQAAGHALGSTVTLSTYVEPQQVLRALSDASLAPSTVFSRPREAWEPRGRELMVES
jgi:hypothetical protein